MEPPKPGEKCALCGQVLPPSGDDEVTAIVQILELCQSVGLTFSSTQALFRAGFTTSDLISLAKLPRAQLRKALLQKATEQAWGDIIAEQNKTIGRASDQSATE